MLQFFFKQCLNDKLTQNSIKDSGYEVHVQLNQCREHVHLALQSCYLKINNHIFDIHNHSYQPISYVLIQDGFKGKTQMNTWMRPSINTVSDN